MRIRPSVYLVVAAILCQPLSAVAEPSKAAPTSPASNASPPRDAIVLFDGRNLDAWLSQKPRQWEESDGPADWKILKDGSLEVAPGTGSLITKQKFGDMKLHFEYRLTHEKTNGGVFLMTRYELGIKNGEAHGNDLQYGCAFENLQNPARPRAAALKPGDEWQIVDVDFRAPRIGAVGKATENARATVVLNGITIHDDVELGPRKGAGKRLGDASTGPLMLQEHGTSYQFRNIWLIDRSGRSHKGSQSASSK
jgi:hypothetical protein